MSTPRITVGLPVYKGANLIAKALECLQRQTFSNFEVIISVDGNDEETAVACRPFLTDPRFRMVVHSDRLDWVGNFNWLLQQHLHEFFCYRQHDDTTSPDFFEILLQAADDEPHAAAIYADCRYTGVEFEVIETAPSIEGELLERIFQYIQQISALPARGLIRVPAIRQAGLVRSDEFRATWQIGGWLTKLLHWGNFKRVAKPIYYRLYRADSVGNEIHSRPNDYKEKVWPTMFTALLDAVIPICRTPEERLFMQQAIFDKIVAHPSLRRNNQLNSSDSIIVKCVERVNHEGNLHLLDVQELPAILDGQKRRIEIMLDDQSRLRQAIYKTHQVYCLGKLIYPQSRMRRTCYQVRHAADMLRQLMNVLARQLTVYASRATREAAMLLFWTVGRPILRIDTGARRVDGKKLPSIDEAIDFESRMAHHAFMDGWSHPEPTGRWTDGGEARLAWQLPSNLVGHVYCDVDAYVFTPQGMRPPRIALWANDYFVQIWPAESFPLQRRLKIPRAAVFGRDSLVLTFVVRGMKSPAELGLSADNRKLGIYLRRMRVTSDN